MVETLSPAPMGPGMFARVDGVYLGPVRVKTKRFGSEGIRLFEMRLEIAGSPHSPDVFIKLHTAYTGAWNVYGESREEFTNIPERRYGTQGYVVATSHAPNQLLLRPRPGPLSPHAGSFMIVTFSGPNRADVTWIGKSGWHGGGRLHRVPRFHDPESWRGSLLSGGATK